MKKLLLIIILFTACSKENIEPVVIDITGTYKDVLDLNQEIKITKTHLEYYSQLVSYTFVENELNAIINVVGVSLSNCSDTNIKVTMVFSNDVFTGEWTYFYTDCTGKVIYLDPIIVKFIKNE